MTNFVLAGVGRRAKCSAGRPISRWSTCDDPFGATRFSAASKIPGPPVSVFPGIAESIWSDVVSKPNPGAGPCSLPPVGPGPSKETRREKHVPSHRPQMSSGRLFLDRVGRHQSPSPLHRHPQINTHSANAGAKGDISTLPGRGHFYFALTHQQPRLTETRR